MIIEEVIKKGATLVDVREEIELLADGSITSAHHLPMSELEDNVDKIMQMTTPIVFFCRSGGRAGKVLEYFQQKGMTDIYNGGGYQDIATLLSES